MSKKQNHTELESVTNCDQKYNTEIATQQSIQNCILTIRGQQVMLDRDLAVLYGVETKNLNKAHDRFLIIDNKIYHLGASIKDLGKKIFAFNLMEEGADELLKILED